MIVVGRAHRVFVVLDDDHRVAHVAKASERVEQPVVIARVQADRRFVENVEHADQSAADLARQPNALRFAAGKRRGSAVERQIVEPHIEQELPSRPRISLSTSAAMSWRVAIELQIGEKLDRLGKRPGADFGATCATGALGEAGTAGRDLSRNAPAD